MTGTQESQTSVSRETSPRLAAFCDLLDAWNRRINLVSAADMEHLQARHIADSAQLYDIAPTSTRSWVDLGSGAGFPGLVCAIIDADRGGSCLFTLIESDVRKAAFLREASRITSVNAEVIQSRVEAVSGKPTDVISARALAPLPKLIGYAAPFASAGTIMLFPKGRQAESELTQARRRWHITVESIPSRSDPSGTILKLTEVSSHS